MGRLSYSAWLSTTAVAMALSACGQSQVATTALDDAKAAPAKTRYDLAEGCYALKSDATGKFAVRNGTGFAATAQDAGSAEPFFMQATALGKYLFYTHDRVMLDGSASPLKTATAPADSANWTIDTTGPGRYIATLSSAGKALATDASGNLVLAGTPGGFSFVQATGCSAYPEMPLDIGDTYKGNGVNRPVIGFAEVHSHMGMGSEMSDGAPENHAGPSAAGQMYGQAMNRFGVVEALKDCSVMHGPDDRANGENLVLDQNPTEHRDTVGWPSFVGWPERASLFHQQMYWRWVERAYHSGLRLMTIHGTNIEAFCNVGKAIAGNKDTNYMDEDCVDMGVGLKQVHYLYEIQDYVDAQNGGPGKGWYRIVKDPAEARAVINEGKLAVVPGLEFSNMFGCKVVFNPDGSETDGCTKEQIDSEIERVWGLGVRQLIPFHDVDSALGGTGVFSSVLNEIGFLGTQAFWKMYPCPDVPYFADGYDVYKAGAVMESAPMTARNDPISKAVVAAGGGKYPIYGPGYQCNARGLTELGKYALEKIMKKGFVLDVDHAELTIKQNMLDMGGETSPAYPMLSAHGGHGGITLAQAQQMLNQGGLMYPALPHGKDFAWFVQQVKPIWPASRGPLAVGYGSDANGLRTLPGVRPAGFTPISYPFTLFSGPGWGPQYAAAGIKPMVVGKLSIPGGRTWNPDEDGFSHYGLVPDFVEQARIEGGQEATDALYNSAEAYLRMWEQVRASAAQR